MLHFPPCKINLGLSITAKRSDGYHELESVFYPVPWTDALEILVSDNQGLNFQSSGIPVPGSMDKNLVYKAYQVLSRDFKLPGMLAHLHKNIPMGAGLGGGSSDAASALCIINQLAGLELSTQQLEKYATELGSDCPFFLHEQAMLARGRGEVLSPYPLRLQGWYALIVMPTISVSTAEAYSWIQPKQPAQPIPDCLKLPPENWKDVLVNDFEGPVIQRHPIIGTIKNKLYEQGAIYASMSGSGAAVFGLFREKPDESDWNKYIRWMGFLN